MTRPIPVANVRRFSANLSLSRRRLLGLSAGIALSPAPASLGFKSAFAEIAKSDIQSQVSGAAANLLFAEQGIYGVVMMQTDGTVLYKQNADLPFVAASLYKLIVMVDFYASRDRGDITFDDYAVLQPEYFHKVDEDVDVFYDDAMIGAEVQITELLYAMIAYSSNVAAHALLAMTSPGDLNAVAADLGMANTFLLMPLKDVDPWPPASIGTDSPGASETALRFVGEYGKIGDINLTTPADIATFFMMLEEGNIVSESTSKEMIALLEQQEINDRLPFLLPPGTQCAHKTGDLDGVVHDAGVVYGDQGPIIVVALTEAVLNPDRANSVIQRLGLIAFGDYELPPIPEGTPEATPESPDTSN
jgi:beta-lactamase class A